MGTKQTFPLLRENRRVTKTTTVENELKITVKVLLELIRHAGYELPDPVQVLGGKYDERMDQDEELALVTWSETSIEESSGG